MKKIITSFLCLLIGAFMVLGNFNFSNATTESTDDPRPIIKAESPIIKDYVVTFNGSYTNACGSIQSNYCTSLHGSSRGTGPIEVNWGDSTITCENFPMTHTYSASEIYSVKMRMKNNCSYTGEYFVGFDAGKNSANVNSITLSGSEDKITWKVDGTSSQGYKVVWSKTDSPVYPCRSTDRYHYYSDPATLSDTLDAFDGSGQYYVRVCEYLGGKCGVYSNQITLSLGGSDTGKEVTAIELKDSNGDGKNLTWSVTGYSAQGYKVVWSKNSGPTYPTRDGDQYHYYSDPNKLNDAIDGFAGDGVYYARVCEYLGGKCGVYSNEIKVNITSQPTLICTTDYTPVCGKDGKTYSNKCAASNSGIGVAYSGECKSKAEEIADINNKAKLLKENQLDTILAELKELRNLVREQQTELKYLRSLVRDMAKLSEEFKNSIKNFIAYGVDENTKKLGEGERAAVINSYKNAYGQLPSSESDLADAIKIANGRWPSKKSETMENKMKAIFKKIYKRTPNTDNANDNAALTIMSYGLKQKAENRNLESEKNGMEIFKKIFYHYPKSTEDWNVLQAITYSGAKQ